MQKNAVRAATIVAYTSSIQLIFGVASRSINFSNPAAAIVGTDNRKENRAAVSRLSPQNSAAVMVTPEREVPGMTANICARPISRLVFHAAGPVPESVE